MNSKHPEDIEILALFHQDAASQSKALNLLILKYGSLLYKHIYRLTKNETLSKDILQEVFIKVWKNIHSFREEATLYSWLYRIASNESYTALKKEKKHFTPTSTSQLGIEIHAGNELLDLFPAEKIEHLLRQAIDNLPEKQKLVFELKYFEEKTYEEIQVLTGTSIGALKASFFHASQKINEFLHSQLNH